MSLKRYQNELIVLGAFLFMCIAYLYKYSEISAQRESMTTSKIALLEVEEVIALKKIWSDKKTTQKMAKFKTLLPESKVTWHQKNKKVTASYKGLNDKELNTLSTKLLNLPIEIKKIQIKKVDSFYDVEIKCQW